MNDLAMEFCRTLWELTSAIQASGTVSSRNQPLGAPDILLTEHGPVTWPLVLSHAGFLVSGGCSMVIETVSFRIQHTWVQTQPLSPVSCDLEKITSSFRDSVCSSAEWSNDGTCIFLLVKNAVKKSKAGWGGQGMQWWALLLLYSLFREDLADEVDVWAETWRIRRKRLCGPRKCCAGRGIINRECSDMGVRFDVGYHVRRSEWAQQWFLAWETERMEFPFIEITRTVFYCGRI